MEGQLGLFGETEAARVKPEKKEASTTIRAGRRTIQIPLYKKRREALEKLESVLDRLEGKDICISYCGGNASHFWLNNLKLTKLRVETFTGGDKFPSVIVLWGSRDASVRIFTQQMVNVHEQEYQGYLMWLVDFWNGFWEHPIDPYRPKGYTSLRIARFKD